MSGKLLRRGEFQIEEDCPLALPLTTPLTRVHPFSYSKIQTWSDAFKNNPDLQGVYEIYEDLVSKGVEFPMTDIDAMPPIHTP